MAATSSTTPWPAPRNTLDDWPDETYWSDGWWSDDSWQFVDEPYGENLWYEDEIYYDDYEDWSGQTDAEPGHQGGDEVQWDQSEGINSAGGYRPGGGKGKSKNSGPFGTGCYICGSRWHLARDCPVKGKSGGKGKSWSGGKSKGHFGGGKGKSKGKGKGKGYKGSKGYGKPRYYADWDRSENQLRHAREGLHLGMGDSPPKKTETQYFNISKDAEAPKTYFDDRPHSTKRRRRMTPESPRSPSRRTSPSSSGSTKTARR